MDPVEVAPDKVQEISVQQAYEWAFQVINAFEANEIYWPELCIAAKTPAEAAELIGAPIRAANETVLRDPIPMTLSDRRTSLRDAASLAKLAEVKKLLEEKLGRQ